MQIKFNEILRRWVLSESHVNVINTQSCIVIMYVVSFKGKYH